MPSSRPALRSAVRRGRAELGESRRASNRGRVDVRAEGEFGQREVGGVRVAEDEERVARLAEPAAEEPRLRRPAGPFLRDERQQHVRHDRLSSAGGSMPTTEPMRGVVVGPCAAADLAAVVAGECAVHRRRVGVVDAVVRRADERAAVHLPGELRQVLAEQTRRARSCAMGRNSPRNSAAASGFGSHMSMWPGPPFIQNRMTLVSRGGAGLRRSCRSPARPKPPRGPAWTKWRRVTPEHVGGTPPATRDMATYV